MTYDSTQADQIRDTVRELLAHKGGRQLRKEEL